jgi:hypothetical protein
MIIKKCSDFIIKEEVINDTPYYYMDIVLNKIKKIIEGIFDENTIEDETQNPNFEKTIKKAKTDGKNKEDKLSFSDLGVVLNSSELSKFSKMMKSLDIKFSDDSASYDLYIAVSLKDAIPTQDKEFSADDIKKCFVKFKKYDIDTFEVIGQLTKNVDIKDIDEDFLVDLKIEIDKEFGSDEDDFEIEMEK